MAAWPCGGFARDCVCFLVGRPCSAHFSTHACTCSGLFVACVCACVGRACWPSGGAALMASHIFLMASHIFDEELFGWGISPFMHAYIPHMLCSHRCCCFSANSGAATHACLCGAKRLLPCKALLAASADNSSSRRRCENINCTSVCVVSSLVALADVGTVGQWGGVGSLWPVPA